MCHFKHDHRCVAACMWQATVYRALRCWGGSGAVVVVSYLAVRCVGRDSSRRILVVTAEPRPECESVMGTNQRKQGGYSLRSPHAVALIATLDISQPPFERSHGRIALCGFTTVKRRTCCVAQEPSLHPCCARRFHSRSRPPVAHHTTRHDASGPRSRDSDTRQHSCLTTPTESVDQ